MSDQSSHTDQSHQEESSQQRSQWSDSQNQYESSQQHQDTQNEQGQGPFQEIQLEEYSPQEQQAEHRDSRPRSSMLSASRDKATELEGIMIEYKPSDLANLQFAKNHGKAQKVYKLVDENFTEQLSRCPCCLLPVQGDKFSMCTATDELRELGSGFPLYFYQQKIAIFLLIILLVVAGVGCLIGNLQQSNLDEWTDEESTLNKVGPGRYGKDNQDIAYQPGLHLLAGIILMIAFPIWYAALRERAIQIDLNTISPADFTLMFKGLPTDFKKREFRTFLEQNSFDFDKNAEIVTIVKTYDVKEQIQLSRQLVQWKATLKYIRESKLPQSDLNETTCCCCTSTFPTIQECQAKVDQLKAELNKISADLKEFKKTSIVFVTYRRQIDARYALERWGLSLIKRWYYQILDACNRGGKYSFNGYYIYAEQAPEPSDVYWENLSVTGYERMKKRAKTYTIMGLILFISFIMMFLIGNWQTSINEDNEDIFTVTLLSAIPSFLIVFINFILGRLARIFASMEKHKTWTEYNLSVGNYLIISMFLNTGVIPLLVNTNVDEQWFTPGGLVVDVFWILLANAFFGPMVYLISPMYQVRKCKRRSFRKQLESKGACNISQQEANILFEGPEIDMANRNANMVKTVLISLSFSPFLPIAPILGILGIVNEYWTCKFMLLRVHNRPRRHGDDLAKKVYKWFEYGILFHAIFTYICYSNIDPDDAQGVSATYLLLAIIYFIFPIKSITKCCCKDKTIEILENQHGGEGDPYNDYKIQILSFDTDYERQNPATQKKGLINWLNLVKQAAMDDEDRDNIQQAINNAMLSQVDMSSQFDYYAQNQVDLASMGQFMIGNNRNNVLAAANYTNYSNRRAGDLGILLGNNGRGFSVVTNQIQNRQGNYLQSLNPSYAQLLIGANQAIQGVKRRYVVAYPAQQNMGPINSIPGGVRQVQYYQAPSQGQYAQPPGAILAVQQPQPQAQPNYSASGWNQNNMQYNYYPNLPNYPQTNVYNQGTYYQQGRPSYPNIQEQYQANYSAQPPQYNPSAPSNQT